MSCECQARSGVVHTLLGCSEVYLVAGRGWDEAEHDGNCALGLEMAGGRAELMCLLARAENGRALKAKGVSVRQWDRNFESACGGPQ